MKKKKIPEISGNTFFSEHNKAYDSKQVQFTL